MSACQSQSHAGSSCSTPGAIAARAEMPAIPDGADAIKISETVVTKVAEMLAEEGDPARVFNTASPSTTK